MTTIGRPADDGVLAGSDALPLNRSGRTTALTTISALPRIWSRPLRWVLRLKTRSGPDRTLRRLSFIHNAHWVLIDRFPREASRTRYSYLLFVSNFNGSWLDYIDTFSTAVSAKMNLIWGSSYGFPGARPPRPFTDMVRANDRTVLHYYSAWPDATATEVASALRVRAAAAGIPTDRADDETLHAWRAFVDSAQRDL
jgi:hypothetical protein